MTLEDINESLRRRPRRHPVGDRAASASGANQRRRGLSGKAVVGSRGSRLEEGTDEQEGPGPWRDLEPCTALHCTLPLCEISMPIADAEGRA